MKFARYFFVLFSVLFYSCQTDEFFETENIIDNGEFCINILTDGMMNQHIVTSRGTDIKTPEEQEIKSLHVFIFDKDGKYLEAADKHRYQGYRNIPDGKTVMNIDRNGWFDNDAAKFATVVVVANVESGTFKFDSEDTDNVPPVNVPDLQTLMDFEYVPLTERAINKLPSSGMPMYARMDGINLTNENNDQSVDIFMKALYSRIDISMQIKGNYSDVTGRLPQLTITGAEVVNVPTRTYFNKDEVVYDNIPKKNYDFPASIIGKTIYNNDEKSKVELTFYVFQNLQEKFKENPGYDTADGYPSGIKPDEKQQYKPVLADKENATAFKFSGKYITYNGAVYNATYTLYLGKNHTDDFNVERNKQYKNNITIKGIVDKSDNEDQDSNGHFIFDARVDVSTSNPYFISILKERTLDSHFNVVPMDVYFFNTNPSNPNPPKQTLRIDIDPSISWVRMEKIPAVNMADGSVPYEETNGLPLMATGSPYHAGNGKRKYFTTDLVTTILKKNYSVTMDADRDRVYFYVDENVDVWHLGTQEERTREATVTLTYIEDGIEVGKRELVLEQAKLLEVTFHDDEGGDWIEYDWNKNTRSKKIYIEAYEEYLDHRDPLNEYVNNQVFTGLPWGAETKEIGSALVGYTEFVFLYEQKRECYSNYYWGFPFTKVIVDKTEVLSDINLNSVPNTAAGYCYIKNKRNINGGVDNPKWYLPGIRELERILEDYYIEYTEFQNNYYWSSAAGETGWYQGWPAYDWQITGENNYHARATKAYITEDNKFDYYKSGVGITGVNQERPMYEVQGENGTSGRAMRSTTLRIRAARVDANPQ